VDATATVKTSAVQHRPVIFNVPWVLANQVVRQLLDGSRHRLCPPFQHRFAPAADAFVSLDFQETPAWRYDKSCQSGDFHDLKSG
jgi:hypothetical protein